MMARVGHHRSFLGHRVCIRFAFAVSGKVESTSRKEARGLDPARYYPLCLLRDAGVLNCVDWPTLADTWRPGPPRWPNGWPGPGRAGNTHRRPGAHEPWLLAPLHTRARRSPRVLRRYLGCFDRYLGCSSIATSRTRLILPRPVLAQDVGGGAYCVLIIESQDSPSPYGASSPQSPAKGT